MNKAITVILNETSFEIEDAAYEKLKNYFSEVENYFSEEDAKDEIIKDIENNFASKLEYKISKRKQQTVLEKDIDELISIIGRVEDFEKESNLKNKKQNKNNCKKEDYKCKKLYRNPDDFILAGVCSGLASYLDIESNIVRLIFVLFTLFTGFFPGLIIYFVLWAIVPLATTSSQKLEMNGENINLQNIKEKIYQMKNDIQKATMNEENKNYVKQKVKNLKTEIENKFCDKESNVEKINKRDNIMSIIFKIILLIIGVSFICSAIFGFIGLVFGISFIVFNPELISNLFNLGYFSIRFVEIISIFGIIAALIPLVFILKIGLSLLKRKNIFKLGSSIFLLVLWVFTVSGIIFVSLRYFSYDYIRSNNIYGNEENLEILGETNYIFSNFKNIKIDGPYNVKIKKGDNFKITSNGSDFILNNTKVLMDDETLKISSSNVLDMVFNNNVNFEIELPEINELNIGGCTKVNIEGFDSNENLKLNINGASNVKMDSYSKNIDLNINGASKINFIENSNIINSLNIEINGASKADLSEIKIKSANVKISGASYLKLNMENKLDVKASGMSTVEYIGNPSIKKQVEDLSLLKKTEIDETTDFYSGEF